MAKDGHQIALTYAELKGLEHQSGEVSWANVSIGHQFNKLIDKLSAATEEDYSEFKVEFGSTGHRPSFDQYDYRNKLNRLLARLHLKYFSNDPYPLRRPQQGGTNLNISQEQNTQVYVQMFIDVATSIEQQLARTTDPKETSFLKDVQAKLSGAKDVMGILTLIISTAHAHGITVDQLLKLFPGH